MNSNESSNPPNPNVERKDNIPPPSHHSASDSQNPYMSTAPAWDSSSKS